MCNFLHNKTGLLLKMMLPLIGQKILVLKFVSLYLNYFESVGSDMVRQRSAFSSRLDMYPTRLHGPA